MPTAAVVLERSGEYRRIVVAVALACLTIISLSTLYGWQDYEETLGRGEERVSLLATAMENHVSRAFGQTEAAMRTTVEFFEDSSGNPAALQKFVAAERRRHPDLSALLLVDSNGIVAADVEPPLRDALLKWALPLEPESGALTLGQPLSGVGGSPPVIPVLLRTNPGSQVLVIAALRSDFLERFPRDMRMGDSALCVLLDRSGTILGRAPALAGAIGRNISASALYKAAPAGPTSGIVAGISPSDGVDRVMAFRRLALYPLSTNVGIGRSQLLAPWRERARRDAIVAAVLLFVIGLFGRIAWLRARGEGAARIALVESEEHHRTALTTLAEGVVTQDTKGAIITWNAAALNILGLTADQLRGVTSLDPRWRAVHEDGSDFPGAEHPAMRALATGEAQLGVLMGIESGDRTRRWLKVSAVPTKSGGKMDGVAVSFHDISEIRAALEAVERANASLEARVAARTEALARTSRELEQLVYSMAHTMRAPLRHIGSFATLLEEDAGERLDADDLGLVRRIRESAGRQARLVDDLLRYTAGHQTQPNYMSIAMDALVSKAQRDICARMPDAERVEWMRHPLPNLYGDPAMVAEILDILMSNAVKFSSRVANPVIRIEPCEIAGLPGIAIHDNGVGFDMHYADKLFGVFQRLHETEDYPGSGMDLAICKRLVERQGGQVAATGEPGHGATFRFCLSNPRGRDTARAPADGSSDEVKGLDTPR